MDLLKDDIKKVYFKYLAASVGSVLITTVYSLVDMAMVGQYEGPAGAAALAVVAPVYNIIFGLGMLSGIGGSVLYGVARGSGKKEEADRSFTAAMIFALLLVLAAVLSKIVGCGLGGKLCRMTNHQSLVVGIGMVARSEVALMVAQKGINAGMIDPVILPAIVLSVIVSALLTPVLLKLSISRGPELA